MRSFGSTIWKQTPFLRLCIFIATGIFLQHQFHFTQLLLIVITSTAFLTTSCFSLLKLYQRFRHSYAVGILLLILFAAIGALLTASRDIRNDSNWVGYHYKPGDIISLVIQEPLVEKTASYKAVASVRQILHDSSSSTVKGNIIVYIKKEDIDSIRYGSRLLVNATLQPVRNSGNPGAFDFQSYCLFQGITHQVYLTKQDYHIMAGHSPDWLNDCLYRSQQQTYGIIRKYIPSHREQGMAEALLIGYKNDLDKDLVQSYTNTGVVHVIAISGLHLGLIYWLLTLILKPISRIKKLKWLSSLFIISGLWTFSLLAGGQPSILRSALMFSILVLGQNTGQRAAVYNSLACSAFMLLCFNPFWLWDAGFLLSYSALLSILIFMKPIYGLLYFENKFVDWFWQLNAVTFAAQILTIPISIYFFHQFPTYFWLTNFFAVPLSTLILFLLIMLCICSFSTIVAAFIAGISKWLIIQMNLYIERVEKIPFAVWKSLQWSALQVLIVYLAIAILGYAILEKKRTYILAVCCVLCFLLIRTISFITAKKQRLLIVYNISRQTAIDFVNGRHACFIGDPVLKQDIPAATFNLVPARTLLRFQLSENLNALNRTQNALLFAGKRILIVDRNMNFKKLPPTRIDYLVICRNPKIKLEDISRFASIGMLVIDGSNSLIQVERWKEEALKLNIPCYSTTANGAFVMHLP